LSRARRADCRARAWHGLRVRRDLRDGQTIRPCWAAFSRPRASARRVLTGLPRPMLKRLTPAEREVVDLAVLGYSNRQLALRRCVSESTVVNQLSSAYRKLGVTSRRELCALALRSSSRPKQRTRPDVSLTRREQLALDRAEAGLSNKLIADSLGVAISTVSTMLTRARRKLRSSTAMPGSPTAQSKGKLSTVSATSVFKHDHNE